jgi:hypothetical protein
MPLSRIPVELGTTAVGFRNRIINGDMRIDQRNAGASVTPTADGQYTLDRFKIRLSQASKLSVQQNAGSVTPPAGFRNYLGITSLSSFSAGSSDFFALMQNIEGFNMADWAFGTASATAITMSFWVRSSLTGQFSGVVYNDGNTRNCNFVYTVSAANTWEHKTITIPGDTSGTWASTNANGLQIWWDLGSGSTYTGTATSWAASAPLRVTGSQSVVGTNGATFYITGVQLEAGSVASPFERRDYGRELMMCQRYLPAFLGGSNAFFGSALNSTQQYVSVNFPVQVRTAPTGLFISSASHFTVGDYISSAGPCTSMSLSIAGLNNASIIANVTSPTVLTQARPGNMSANSASAILYFTGCEL